MKKKFYLLMTALLFFGYQVSAAQGEWEEIGFVLFQPNSSNRPADVNQAAAELDYLAGYLQGRNLSAGQISVLGYAAAASNNVDSGKLSKDRALYVTGELQKRGVGSVLFSEPIAYGEADTWGGNTAEESRRLNRRVRIMLYNNVDNTVADSVPVAVTPEETSVVEETVEEAAVKPDTWTVPSVVFWFLLLLILLIGIVLCTILFFILPRDRKKSSAGAVTETDSNINAVVSENKQQETPLHKRSNFMEMEKAVRDIIIGIPFDMYFDVHTIVEILLQEHDDVYLTNVGHYTSAAHYHSRISVIIAENTDIVEKIGDSYSKNIHDKFTDCHLFRRLPSPKPMSNENCL